MSRWLRKQIDEVVEKYPSLSFDEGEFVLRGDFPLINPATLETIEEYSLEFLFSRSCFATELPKVFETAAKLPRIMDRHIYKDGGFCLATKLDEFLICHKGITLLGFIEELVKPFLATQTLISLGEIDSFPQGEYSHEGQGVFESYQAHFNIDDLNEIIGFVDAIVTKKSRNSLCFCGSEKKYKRCHAKVLDTCLIPPHHILKSDLQALKSLQEKAL